MESNSGDNSIVQYNEKIKMVLEKFLDPDFHIQNDLYLNRLITHLSGNGDGDFQNPVINLPIFTEWLIQAIGLWEVNNLCPTTNIAAFTLNLTSIITKNEYKFNYLDKQNFYIRLINIIQHQQQQQNIVPIIKVNYIKLLNSILEHNSGIEWMIRNPYWQDVINLTLNNHTLFITNEGWKFIGKLLEKVIDTDMDFCRNVVKTIIAPLNQNSINGIENNQINGNNNNNNNNNLMVINDERMYQKLSPTLQLIDHILEYFLESSLFAQKNFRIVLMFINDYCLEQIINNYMLMAGNNKLLAFETGKILFIIQFLELYIKVVENRIKPSDIEETISKIMCIFNIHITYGNYENLIKFCYFGQFYWNIIGYKVPCKCFNKRNEPIEFANQLILLQVFPAFCMVHKYLFENFTHLENLDEFQDAFFNKCLRFMCHCTMRLSFVWRSWLLDQTNLFDISLLALTYIMKSRKYYPRERAAIIFQSLIYVLRDIINAIKDNPEKLLMFQRQQTVLSAIFEVLTTFIEEFNITWRDSIEAICVLGLSFDFLTIPTWPTILAVKALKLVQISIAKYMPPNLALLIDNTKDSTIALIGPLLYAKLYDSTWEVRDSALEVVCTITQLSNTKFPSLQKVLIDSDLPDLILKMATNDSESFVRASAIKCLQEMIKVDDIWNNALKSQDLPKKMREILLNETEGIVRVEAATFLCVYYENRKFFNETLDEIYDTMIHASTIDLHWEVKVRSLLFWELVIINHLHNQGMIDGRFPEVTFSKEHRKIVALTHNEIKKRLQKVLQQLSNIGCLGVLLSAINDDCDIEVTKQAVKITQKFVDFLKNHNITQSDLSIPSSPLLYENASTSSFDDYQNNLKRTPTQSSSTTTLSPAPTATTSMIDSDDIIEQIINSEDINLLRHVYASSDYGSVVNYDLQVRKIVEPNDFLMFTKQDLNNIINVKKNWLNSIENLGSLLDDMLKTYNNDINTMDCY